MHSARLLVARLSFTPVFLLALTLAAACTGPQNNGGPRWEDTSDTGPSPDSSDPSANADFDAAVALYHAGEYERALEAFRLFGAEFPSDPLAIRAEIFSARIQAALGQILPAEAAFRSLHAAPDGPETRAAAAVYVAFALALRGQNEQAFDFLVDQLAADGDLRVPLGWVVPGDEALLAAGLAEARIQIGATLSAFADLALVAEFGDEGLREYAVERAIQIASELPRAELQRAFVDADEFAAATIAPALAELHVDAGDTEGARDVLLSADVASLRYGRPERHAELREVMNAESTDRAAQYGVALSLTGPTRRAGRAALGAVLLAQRSFEDRTPISAVLIRDTGGTVEGARAAVAELVDAGVAVIIGPIEGDLAEASRLVGNSAGVPIVTLSPVGFSDGIAGTFRWLLAPRAEAAKAIEVAAEERGARRYVIVEEPSDTPSDFMSTFADAAENAIDSRGGSVRDRVVLLDDPDDASVAQASAREAARAIAATDADTVVLALPDGLAATLVAYLASEDIWPSPNGETTSSGGRRQVTYVANSFVATPALLRNSGSYLEGAIIPYWFNPELATGAGREFADRFAFTFGREAGTVEAFAFDAARAIRRLLVDENATAPDAVAARLSAGIRNPGVLGEFRFDALGNPAIEPSICTVRDERFVTP